MARLTHGTTTGSVVFGGRQVSTEHDRGLTIEGTEIELDPSKVFSSADLLNCLVVERTLAGLAIRCHQTWPSRWSRRRVTGQSMSKSAISRRSIAATKTALAQLWSGMTAATRNSP